MQQLGGGRQGVVAVGGADAVGTGPFGSNVVTAPHEAFDASPSDRPALRPQGGVNTWGSLAFAVLVMEALDIAVSNCRFVALRVLSGRVRQAW